MSELLIADRTTDATAVFSPLALDDFQKLALIVDVIYADGHRFTRRLQLDERGKMLCSISVSRVLHRNGASDDADLNS